jgi:endonuclease III
MAKKYKMNNALSHHRAHRMTTKPHSPLSKILARLERFYGKPQPPRAILPDLSGAADPYEMILYANCGYPATDASCTKGFEALKKEVGLRPDDILKAPEETLTEVFRGTGMFPERRGVRIREIAARVKHEFAGNLGAVLKGPLPQARKALKSFPTIGDPGADKILLFTRTASIAAVPSNCVEVAVRLVRGQTNQNYGQNYREAQEIVRAGVAADCDSLLRAHLLLKQHGQEICKRTRPKCDQCPVSPHCAYLWPGDRGGPRKE